MSKTDVKGRTKYGNRFIQVYHYEIDSVSYRKLSCGARALWIKLRSLFYPDNNGEIFLSVRDAAEDLNVAHNTVRRFFKELIDGGFIKENIKGAFTRKNRHATTWIITCHPYKGMRATKEFMKLGLMPKKNKRYQPLPDIVSTIEPNVAE
ncbi:MAG: helix-turn-helix domain-containing protein [Alphaproteobacteria bacterium]|nr:helix-turn-helix domain-containing protein [Alphaproteobacteria bacterium]